MNFLHEIISNLLGEWLLKRRILQICREPVGNGETDWSANKPASEVRKLKKKVRTGKRCSGKFKTNNERFMQ